MLRSLYSGISGMRGFQTKLDVIGNNIANVNTPGFKASRVVFQDVLSQTISGATAPNATNKTGGINPKQIGLGTGIAAIDTIHTPGSFQSTNIPTDLAIEGDGFFAVNTKSDGTGSSYLTRAGNFKLDADDYLVTSNGNFVLDKDGNAIKFDTTTSGGDIAAFSISSDGSIVITDDKGAVTTLSGDPKIGIAKVKNPSGLEKVGNSMYKLTGNADSETDVKNLLDFAQVGGRGGIISGVLEMSNVDLSNEFTEMIVAQRGFQANTRIITTSDEILQELVNLKR